MFLIERLVGVGLYSVVLIIVCLFMTDKKVNLKKLLFIYAFILAIGGWFYVPDVTSDLYRINNEFLFKFDDYSFQYMLETYFLGGSLRVDYIYYWIFAQIGEPRLLPAFNTLAVYLCIFYILIRSSEIFGVNRKNLATVLFFIMSTGSYMFVVTGIRSMLGCAILAVLFFKENIEKKFSVLHIPLYFIAMFMHNFVLVLVGVRFVTLLFDKELSQKTKVLLACLFLLVGLAGVVILSTKILQLLNHIKAYLTKTVYFYIWDYISAVICLVVSVTFLSRMNLVNSSRKKRLSTFTTYLILCAGIAVCFFFEFSIFYRTNTYIVPIILIPVMINVLQSRENRLRGGNAIVLRHVLLAASVLLLGIACVRGSLCGLKFFVL